MWWVHTYVGVRALREGTPFSSAFRSLAFSHGTLPRANVRARTMSLRGPFCDTTAIARTRFARFLRVGQPGMGGGERKREEGGERSYVSNDPSGWHHLDGTKVSVVKEEELRCRRGDGFVI